MYLSFSGYKRATGCLLSFWHVYLNKTQHGKPDDRLGSIYGSAVGILFEKFYEDKLWSQPNTRDVMEAMAPGIVDQLLEDETKPGKVNHAGVIMWKGEGEGQNPRGLYCDRDELVRDVQATVGRGLRTIKENLLIARGASAELKLNKTVGNHYLSGKADFVMRRVQHKDSVIIDGKGTTHTKVEDGVRIAKYFDAEQLLWYAMLFNEHYGRLPDRTAYLYWKYEPPFNLTWYEFEQEQARLLKERVLDMADQLLEKRTIIYGDELTENQLAKGVAGPSRSLDVVQEYYPPTANQQNCQFCPYATEDLCPEGATLMNKLRSRWENRKV